MISENECWYLSFTLCEFINFHYFIQFLNNENKKMVLLTNLISKRIERTNIACVRYKN